MAQTYDALGRIASETFPDNETVTYTYNEAGWLSSAPGYINGITYNARGQKTALTYANNLTTTWTYNASNFRVTNRTTSNNQQNLTYGYDNNGNVISITDSLFTASRTFTYDDLNRMVTGSGTFGTNQSQQNCTYAYNAIGNLTDKCGAILSYGDAMHPSAVTNHAGLGKSYTYDANGNMLTRGNQTLTWDIDNRVSSIAIAGGGSTSMEYDYAGIRVKKNAPTGITLYPFAGYEIDPSGVITKFIRIGIENYASKKGTNKYFYHNDHLGSVNVITDIVGTRVQLNEYDPWGSVSRSEGSIDPTQRFTGQKLDPETGLYYYGGRYYDAEIGRFISADPFVQTPLDPQNLNRYSYVVNNPQNYIDPDGYFHRHKKSGGFFNSIFGSILRIIVDTIFLVVGVPPAWEGAIAVVGNVLAIADLGHAVTNLTSNEGGPGSGSSGPVIPGLNAVGGAGMFSPALQLAMASSCDVCEDPVFSAARIGMWFDFEGGFGGRRGRLRGIPAGGTPAEQERIYRAREARANSWGIKQRRQPEVGGGADLKNLSALDIQRIQNAANRTGLEISVVGSRPSGTAGPLSDWDYVVPGATSAQRHSLSSSLPSGSRLGLGTPRNQDIFTTALDKSRPYITFFPK